MFKRPAPPDGQTHPPRPAFLTRLFSSPSFYWGALAVGLILIAGAVALEKGFTASQWREFTTLFVGELGIAVVIAVILAFTFERASAREFREIAKTERDKAKEDVFHSIYGYHLPGPVRDEIIEQIFKSPFTRKNVALDCYFDTVKHAGRRYLKLSISMKYELHNTSPEPQVFPALKSDIDVAPVSALDSEVKMTHVEAKGCENPFRVSEADLKMTPDGQRMKFKLPEEYSIKVLCERPTVVTIRYQSICQLSYGQKTFHWERHVWGINLTVHLRDELTRRLTVNARSFGAPLQESPHHHPEQGYLSWHTERPILPGQGVEVDWRLVHQGSANGKQSPKRAGSRETPRMGPIEKLVGDTGVPAGSPAPGSASAPDAERTEPEV